MMNEYFTKRNDFHVPEEYFDELPSRIHQRIEGKKKTRSNVFTSFPRSIRLASVLATLFLVALVTTFLLVPAIINRPPDPNGTKGISYTELTEYFNVDESAVIEVMTTEIPSELLSFNGNISPEIEMNGEMFNRDDLIEYLVEKDHPEMAVNSLSISEIINPN